MCTIYPFMQEIKFKSIQFEGIDPSIGVHTPVNLLVHVGADLLHSALSGIFDSVHVLVFDPPARRYRGSQV